MGDEPFAQADVDVVEFLGNKGAQNGACEQIAVGEDAHQEREQTQDCRYGNSVENRQ